MRQFARLVDTRLGLPLLWAALVLVALLAPFFVIAGFAGSAGRLDDRAVAVAQSELAPLIRQRTIPPALVESVSGLLARSELGFNYVTLRNANGVILVSQGRYEELADWLPSSQARQLRGLLYRTFSDDQRITLRHAGAVVGYMDYGISLRRIVGQVPLSTWIWLLLGLAALVAAVWQAAPAWAALRSLQERSPVSGGAGRPAKRASPPPPPPAERAPIKTTTATDPLAAFAAVADRLDIAVLTVDHNGGIKSVNESTERLFGVPATRLRGQAAEAVMTLVDQEGHALASPVQKCLRSGDEVYRERTWLRRSEGTSIGIELIASPLEPPLNAAAVMMLCDADQSMRSLLRTDELAGMAEILLSRIEEAVIVVNDEGRAVYASAACTAVLGYTREGIKGVPMKELLPQVFASGIRHERDWIAASAVRPGGESVSVMVSTAPLTWNRRTAYVVILRSAASDAQAALPSGASVAPESLGALAYHDQLTGLASRRLLMERIEGMLREEESPHGWLLLLVDLAAFKRINHGFGRDIGDRLLVAFARTLEAAVEDADVVARLGGDEFAVLVPATGDDEADAYAAARRLQAAFVQPLQQDGLDFVLRLDIGIARADDVADSAELLRRAETALYAAKDAADGEARLYAPNMRLDESDSPQAEALRRAVASGALSMRLLPIQRVGEGKQVAAALAHLEWRPDDGKPLADRALLEHAKAHGLLGEVGAWCVRRLGQEHANWRDIGLAEVPILLPAIPELAAEERMREMWVAVAERYRIPDAALILQMPPADGGGPGGRDIPSGMRLAQQSRFDASPPEWADVLCLSPSLTAGIPKKAEAVTAAKALASYGRKHRKAVVAGPADNDAQYKGLVEAGIDCVYGAAISEPLTGRAFGRYLAKHGNAPL